MLTFGYRNNTVTNIVMKNILIISKREIIRLRTRFTGKSRLLVLGIMALALVVSFSVYKQELVMGQGLYIIGVSPDGPVINDQRFNIITLDRASGFKSLYEKNIDAFVLSRGVIYRSDARSQYATSALKKYLASVELDRIASEYEIDDAFPLRIEVRYLDAPELTPGVENRATLSDILGLTDDPTELKTVVDDSLTEPGFTDDIYSVVEEETVSGLPNPSTTAEESSIPQQSPESNTDDAVRQQLTEFKNANGLPKFEAKFVSNQEIIIPSLMTPPTPLAQVILAFLYVVPIFFVSVFFTSAFIQEKTNRKLIILLSAPITPLQIILGKILPYIGYSVIAIIAITLLLNGNVLLGLAIFIPVMLFILAIYLMVALLYRTFKDQTFFSVLAVWVITGYLVAPAMFSGVSDLSYISPLTLAVQMYRGESFGLTEYLLSTTPMYLVFICAVFVGTRIFNEEYLMGFRPLHTKLSEAVFLSINRDHLYISMLFLSLALIPIVFMVQLASIVMASNLPMPYSLWALLLISVVVEEIAKSTGVMVLLKNDIIRSKKTIIALSAVSAFGFLIGEKLLLYIAMSVISESMFTEALFSAGLLVVPLLMHFVATAAVGLTMSRLGMKYYPVAILAGSVIHILYNLYVIGVIA